MKRIPKQEDTAEFKEQAVKRTDEIGSFALRRHRHVIPLSQSLDSLML